MRVPKHVLTVAILFFSACRAAEPSVSTYCPITNVCFKLNIPSRTASSGAGDIFLQIIAPSTYSWVALGLGTAMPGSNIFVVYTSALGTNVTVSPRLATGYVEPVSNADTVVTPLSGSWVGEGEMRAVFRCVNCHAWPSGSTNFSTPSGKWIWAALTTGDPLQTDDVSAPIRQHDKQAAFEWSWSDAKGGDNDVENPFGAAEANGSSVSPLPVPQPTSGPRGTATGVATGAGASASTSSANSSSETETSTTNVSYGLSTAGKAAIGAIGGLVAIALLVAGYFCCVRQPKKRKSERKPPAGPSVEADGAGRVEAGGSDMVEANGGRRVVEADAWGRPVEVDGRGVRAGGRPWEL